MKNKKIILLCLPLLVSLCACNIRKGDSSLTSSSSDSSAVTNDGTSTTSNTDESSSIESNGTSNVDSTSSNSTVSSDTTTSNTTSTSSGSTSSSTSVSSDTSISSGSSTSETTSSSSSSGTEGVVSSYSLIFGNYNNTNGLSPTEITNGLVQNIDGLSIDSVSSVFGDGEGIRLGSSKKTGSITLSHNANWIIKSIVISSKAYNKDTDVEVEVKLSNGEVQTNTVNSIGDVMYEFNQSSPTNSFTISTKAQKKRAYIYSITINAVSGQNQGGITKPDDPIDENKFKYTSSLNPTNSKVPSEKTNYDGYYQPIPHSTMSLKNLGEWNSCTYLPSEGKSKLLVVPVDFSDYRASSKLEGGETKSRELIYDNFFGNSEDTGWESVRTYYEKSSYGALTIEGEVTPWFHSTYTTTSFENLSRSSDGYYPTWTMLEKVTDWVKNTLKIDLTEYDNDKDGFVDGIWMVYANPVGQDENSNVYWAYTYWDYDNYDKGNIDSPVGYNYCWASYEFMFEGGYSKPDAHTYIHETGHLLGLDDYYSYDENVTHGEAGGVDMMDWNIADHNAYSKYLLNWVSPYVVDGTKDTVTINLKPFESSGECILLRDNTFNDSPYDEYIMIEYYTPTGLNEKDLVEYSNGLSTYSNSGVKIYHVDSRVLRSDSKTTKYVDSINQSEFEDPNIYYYLGASNTEVYSCDDANDKNSPYRLIHLIEATNQLTFANSVDYSMNYGNNNILFAENDSFDMYTYRKFFNKVMDLNDGTRLPYAVTIGSMTSDGVNITINKY